MKERFSSQGQQSVASALAKTIESQGEFPLFKSLEFDIKGQLIVDAVKTKIAALQAQRLIYDALQNVPRPVAVTSSGEKVEAPMSDYQWRINGIDRDIARLERLLRHLDEKKSYKLSEYDLEYYGL